MSFHFRIDVLLLVNSNFNFRNPASDHCLESCWAWGKVGCMLEMVKGPATQLSRMNNLSYVVGVRRRERPPFSSLTNNLGYFPASQPLVLVMETICQGQNWNYRFFFCLSALYLSSLIINKNTLHTLPTPTPPPTYNCSLCLERSSVTFVLKSYVEDASCLV